MWIDIIYRKGAEFAKFKSFSLYALCASAVRSKIFLSTQSFHFNLNTDT